MGASTDGEEDHSGDDEPHIPDQDIARPEIRHHREGTHQERWTINSDEEDKDGIEDTGGTVGEQNLAIKAVLQELHQQLAIIDVTGTAGASKGVGSARPLPVDDEHPALRVSAAHYEAAVSAGQPGPCVQHPLRSV
ncbi:hypothetical protein NDU88_004801 [Pleurodeles waltl]|uniref:Uncharacterized protein n=1 Tax=Pleurodeles waltl TaxID=8319 RepID=A0AAV7L2F9_PLEWA|nr:hypothetical protein NDU88_004801 [Pleurodeles waltl]